MIAILPLRKNSKRLLNKNIKKINQKPLYNYILNTLVKSKEIKKIVITTDYNLKISNKKIVLLKRPKNLRGNCSMNLVIKDVLQKIKGEYFIQTHATSPLLKEDTLDKAIKYFKFQKKYDSIISVTEIKKRFWNSRSKPLNHKINQSPTTQILKPIFEENSGFYIFTRQSFLKKKNRIGIRPKLYKINKIEGMDIDDKYEFELIKKILEK